MSRGKPPSGLVSSYRDAHAPKLKNRTMAISETGLVPKAGLGEIDVPHFAHEGRWKPQVKFKRRATLEVGGRV